jgi:hypothetical protein
VANLRRRDQHGPVVESPGPYGKARPAADGIPIPGRAMNNRSDAAVLVPHREPVTPPQPGGIIYCTALLDLVQSLKLDRKREHRDLRTLGAPTIGRLSTPDQVLGPEHPVDHEG